MWLAGVGYYVFMLQNKVQLIVYPDSVDGNLAGVAKFIDIYLKDLIGGVHILPFYPSSADRGFAPLTHLEVDPAFGTWTDIKQIATQYDLVVDLTVNHVSVDSEYFQDFLQKGDASLYRDMFLDIDRVLKRYGVTDEAFAEIYRPRPTLPYTSFEFADGSTRRLWTTFTSQQIDFDVEAGVTRDLVVSFINHLAEQGVKLIRLDAVGYCVKRPHTTSFLIPETLDYIGWLRQVTPEKIDLLAEIHYGPDKQVELLNRSEVEWVYDFSLPLLILHAIHASNATNLKHWITIRPYEQITTLDTHDGIGVVDVEYLMSPKEIEETTAWVKQNGGNEALRASGEASGELDVYQINCTYYSALGTDDDAYIVARAIQFFVPGIPQVYYVGLLAGTNDLAVFNETKRGRDVNRHNYTWSEITAAMEQSVVARLLKLMKFRSSYPAFDGHFFLISSADDSFVMKWQRDDLYCQAEINLVTKEVWVEWLEPQSQEIKRERF